MRNLFRILFATVALAAPLTAYVPFHMLDVNGQIVPRRWKSGPIRWSANPIRGANVTGAREQADVFRASFAKWQSVTTASISFTEGSPTAPSVIPAYDQINVITSNLTPAQWNSLGGGTATALTLISAYPQGGPGFVDMFDRPIEFNGQILEADIMFNPSTSFTTNLTPVADRFDLESFAAHEIGHLLGLSHTSIVGSTMFPALSSGLTYWRTLSTDDMAGVSTIYPAPSFPQKGTISGTIRTMANIRVYGAIVVAVNASGIPVASTVTNPNGQYTIAGLDAGAYTVYAEPLDRPLEFGNLTLNSIYPGQNPNTNFTTRYR